jgi:hypothetical protein
MRLTLRKFAKHYQDAIHLRKAVSSDGILREYREIILTPAPPAEATREAQDRK